mgnify:CR=1 FL=1
MKTTTPPIWLTIFYFAGAPALCAFETKRAEAWFAENDGFGLPPGYELTAKLTWGSRLLMGALRPYYEYAGEWTRIIQGKEPVSWEQMKALRKPR